MTWLSFFLSLWISKSLFFIIKRSKISAGSTWPGHIALFFCNHFIRKILEMNYSIKTVIVCGTNGKTSTVSLICHLLKKMGYRTFSNQEGANLLNGIASALIQKASFFGKINEDYAIFEVDELSLPKVLKEIKPHSLIILNLFRDQLDRYGEVNTILNLWVKTMKKLDKRVNLIINGDDPQLVYHATNLKNPKFFFGVGKKSMKLSKIPHDVDFNFCPICNSILNYSRLSYGHLGDFFCSRCLFKRKKVNDYSKEKIYYPLGGLYNKYNIHAVLTWLTQVLGFKLKDITKKLKSFTPVFGRQETVFLQGKKIFLLLSKNPSGFNQSLNFIGEKIKNKKKKSYLLLLLNDRIPDGHDISWIWDINFDKEILTSVKQVLIGGDRCYEMAIRIKYEMINEIMPVLVFDYLDDLKKFFLNEVNKNEEIFALANYTAMLELRKLLIGYKFQV